MDKIFNICYFTSFIDLLVEDGLILHYSICIWYWLCGSPSTNSWR